MPSVVSFLSSNLGLPQAPDASNSERVTSACRVRPASASFSTPPASRLMTQTTFSTIATAFTELGNAVQNRAAGSNNVFDNQKPFYLPARRLQQFYRCRILWLPCERRGFAVRCAEPAWWRWGYHPFQVRRARRCLRGTRLLNKR